jgi:hypothetical protein
MQHTRVSKVSKYGWTVCTNLTGLAWCLFATTVYLRKSIFKFSMFLCLCPASGRMEMMKDQILVFELRHRVPARGLPPCRGEEICAPQWLGELCWRERKILVGSLVPDMSKDRGQTKWSTWASRLVVRRGVNDPIQKNLLLGNLQNLCRMTMENTKTRTGL